MKWWKTLTCCIALVGPSASSAQEAGDFTAEPTDYSDYFGESGQPSAPGPTSLGEARQQHRAYR